MECSELGAGIENRVRAELDKRVGIVTSESTADTPTKPRHRGDERSSAWHFNHGRLLSLLLMALNFVFTSLRLTGADAEQW